MSHFGVLEGLSQVQSEFSTTDITTELTKRLKPTVIPTEAEIQADVYSTLKARGFVARLQCRLGGSIFDCVVFGKDQEPRAIIEVKKYSTLPFDYATPQIRRYKEYGLPVFGINNARNVDALIQELDKLGARDFTNDQLFDSMPDLVNDKFRSWYCRMFFVLGKDRVLKIASIARADGKDARKYFSVLVKHEAQRVIISSEPAKHIR